MLLIGVPVALGVFLTRRRAAWRLVHGGSRRLIALLAIPFAVARTGAQEPARAHVVVVNHCSYADSAFIAALLASPHRFVAKRELASIPILGAWLRRLDTVFIERSATRETAAELASLRQALAAGHSVVIFPEGTFTEITGLRPFHLGAFQLAVAAGVPVVPVALAGTRSLLREGRRLLRRTPVRAVMGNPIEPSLAEDEFSAAVSLRDAARRFILAHSGEPDLE